MKLGIILNELDSIAPLRFAQPWDNVGLLVGDRDADVKSAVLCIDYTDAVASEAQAAGVDLVIAYHPPLFKPISRLTGDGTTRLLLDAARRGVAIYSPHTALDVAVGGTNDVLADVLVMRNRRPLRPMLAEPSAYSKLVVFVPRSHTDSVAQAMFEAGAGTVGRYDQCSFRAAGTGTFRGGPGTRPAVGSPGVFERVEEDRLETIAPTRLVPQVMQAARKAHVYEEVAMEVYPISHTGADFQSKSSEGETDSAGVQGIGRVGDVPEGSTIEMMINRIKRELCVSRLLVAGDTDRLLKKAAVCAGAGGDLLSEAIAEKVDLYLTGEVRHHDALRAVAAGVTVVCALHSNSERPTLAKLQSRLSIAFPALRVLVSTSDRDPFSLV